MRGQDNNNLMHYQERLLKADINIATSGDNTIINAPTGTPAAYIVIDHINLSPAATTTVQFKTGSTAYGGAYTLAQSQGLVLENAIQNEDAGVIMCGPNEAFKINLGGNVQTSGFVLYRIKADK